MCSDIDLPLCEDLWLSGGSYQINARTFVALSLRLIYYARSEALYGKGLAFLAVAEIRSQRTGTLPGYMPQVGVSSHDPLKKLAEPGSLTALAEHLFDLPGLPTDDMHAKDQPAAQQTSQSPRRPPLSILICTSAMMRLKG
jgi:hypothetical protein